MFVPEERGYPSLVDLADTDIYYLQTMLGTTHSYIRANRDKTLQIPSKGFVEGIALFQTE